MIASVTAADWQLVQQVGRKYRVDPYVLVAIGMYETGWGSAGTGRPPPDGHGLILGVGAFDSGDTSDRSFMGLAGQLDLGARTLVANGVHTIADLAAGRLHVTPQGRVRWASADVAPNYPWSTGVYAIWQRIHGSQFNAKTSSAWAGPDQEDEMTPQDVVDAVTVALNKGTGQGQPDWAHTQQAVLARLGDIVNVLNRIAAKVGA